MWLADSSIKRPVFATMIILALVVMGAISYPRLGIDLFPKVDFPMVSVVSILRGASPEIVDIDVTDRIEGAVNTINGIKRITSTSSEGVSQIIIEFVLERDVDMAAQDVREKIAAIRRTLPRDIEEPVVQKISPDTVPVLWIAFNGQKSIRELSTYADEVIKPGLQKINGVGDVSLGGLRLRQVRIWLSRERLNAYQMTVQDVFSALQRGNIELPGGKLESDAKEYTVRVKGEIRNIEEFNDLVIAYHRGSPVRLRDVGRAEDYMEEKRSNVRFNGVPSVGLGIQKQSGTNTVEVIGRVKKEVERLRKDLPPGTSLDISFDQSDFIRRSIKEVQFHLVIGGIFAVLIVFVFLRSVRTTLISALAIPTSIVSTFTIMHFFDFTFNNLTMLALSLSIGILIDDAIIVIENIHRHIDKGMKPMEAASFATAEIGQAVTATTLAIIAIFLPVAFMKGIIGRFFLQFALTVVFSVAVSLFVSFTLTPMLASRFLKGSHKPSGALTTRLSGALEGSYLRLEELYRGLLGAALQRRALVLLGAIAIFAGSMTMTRFMGKEFLPKEDQSRFVARLKGPLDYSVEASDRLFRQAEEIVRSTPEVDAVFYNQGGRQANNASMFIRLKKKTERKRDQHAVMAELRKKFREIPGLEGTAEDISMMGGGLRNVPIQYAIMGGDMESLKGHAQQIVAEFKKLPGIVDVDTSLEAGRPEVWVEIDRDKAADLGVEVASVAETVNLLIGGELDATKFKDVSRGRRYDVRARLFPEDRAAPGDIKRLYVRSREGRLVELSSVVSITEAGGPSVINRADRQRAIIVFANLEGKPLGQAMEELNSISSRILPAGFTTMYMGMAETMGESFKHLVFAIVLGVLMAYMVLAAQFESFIHPFTILLSLPLSFVGAFGALILMGMNVSIFSMIGLILLLGLVKKNAILLVDYANTLRARGLGRREAILEAGPVRLRPILMTTFAIIFGMLPIALGIGEGSETRAPMAVTTIGGLLSSLFLTLIVVPVAYDVFDDLRERCGRKNRP